MKIGIITLPLHSNYGGVIQAFVLQNVLRDFGHDVRVISKDPFLKKSSFPIQILRYLKRFALRILKKSSAPVFLERDYNKACSLLNVFVSKRMDCQIVSELSEIRESDYETLIFGSDQIWRPQYAKYGWGSIENAFGRFALGQNVKKIAYAASFGVDFWEMTDEETQNCACLAKTFSAISVREMSGIQLCRDYLGVSAQTVLDPTLLWTKERYQKVCAEIPEKKERFLVAYVLNKSNDIQSLCEQIALEKGLSVRMFSSDDKASLSVQEWLAMFRDASYVVTDSFHGTVFSIIFEKEFKCVYNKSRGNARFESLLDLYNSGKLDEMRQFSLNWLKNALES
ncbi:polysaccharide pyruvyl transferase family protein [Fibrobacter sp. UWH1]|uniref:polysaccharide pyruvyl transferase family protein n=1 Tax=Fibrobacter sp. UWH1 TaxID=1964354 RepID=UPI000B520089|nr:polysaccharide pyruvyl transferase family protein [Fibrobacter sp. UWH1]OWV06479.1 hypothetical protein B7992_14845 [Fibrobacter sp. UWH1]